jgi:hypothetical protein
MTRFTITDDGRVIVHGSMGERAPMPDEVELIREAIEPRPVPAWFDFSVVAAVIAAFAWLGHGIGKGVGS